MELGCRVLPGGEVVRIELAAGHTVLRLERMQACGQCEVTTSLSPAALRRLRELLGHAERAAGLPRCGHLDLAEGGTIEVLGTPAHCALTVREPGGQVATVRLDRPVLTWLRVMLGLAFGQIAARRVARSA